MLEVCFNRALGVFRPLSEHDWIERDKARGMFRLCSIVLQVFHIFARPKYIHDYSFQ